MTKIKTTPKVSMVPRTKAPATVVGGPDRSWRSLDGTQVESAPELGIGGSTPAIVDLIAFHADVRAALDRLDAVVRGDKRGAPDAEMARALIVLFEGPLQWHDEDEEVSLLRRMRAYPLTPVHASVVESAQRGHEKIEVALDPVLKALRKVVDGKPAGDSFAPQAAALRSLMEGHFVLEETNLFPAVVETLSKPELEQAAQEIRARHDKPGGKKSKRHKRVVPL